MLVCISSPVLSKKPVLIKIILSLAFSMQDFRLIVVRLSSSIIPTFTVFFSRLNNCSTASNKSHVKATSSEPCIFGLTIYILLFLEFDNVFNLFRSYKAIHMVNIASKIPSKTSSPLSKITEGFCMRWPTFLTSKRLLPGREKEFPLVSKYSLSSFRTLVSCFPFFSNVSERSPFIRPNQFL